MDGLQSYLMDHEKDVCSKMYGVRKLQIIKEKKGEKIFFDKSVLFKTELARMFIDYMHLDVDRDLVLTACLLCNCKKVDNPQKKGKLYTYAEEGAEYLQGLGFEKRFCKICKGVNRYSEKRELEKGKIPEGREPESDILELVDHFGGWMLDRKEREGLTPENALIQMEKETLKGKNNRYLPEFHEFVSKMQEIEIKDPKIGLVGNKILPKAKKVIDENDIDHLIGGNVIYDFNEIVDNKAKDIFNNNKAMFGGVPNDSYKEKESGKIPLFTPAAIKAAKEAAMAASLSNQKIENDYER